jgi:hypothetical protein
MESSSAQQPSATADTAAKTEMIRHDWTVSRKTLVLSGSRARLLEVAGAIGAPTDQVIDVSPSRSVMALDGDLLLAYQAMADDSSGHER